jgi:hypothetical protein
MHKNVEAAVSYCGYCAAEEVPFFFNVGHRKKSSFIVGLHKKPSNIVGSRC